MDITRLTTLPGKQTKIFCSAPVFFKDENSEPENALFMLL